ncbi:MFS family permease [Streptosporangium becharense]|uniref:MFS family permease n=1 Tax=Streptosporangium becharense TaxID=1816182 RepID=A0A7W9MED2_9ACTN|nr:MFS transporter [Streptosporangium becharense]MBB2910651.1 MFS family permease [Streptosporangium becharense]MBB5817346.1 MFS family permease [Streptosporangium becharense]
MTRLLTVCAGLCFLSLGLLIPTIPKYVTGPLGQGPGLVGGCLAITSVCAVLFRPLAGRMADRRGRRAAACTGAALLAITSLAVLTAESLPLFLACRAVAGAGEALAYVGLAAAAGDHDRPGAAINRFSVAVNAGLWAGPALAEAGHSVAGLRAAWALSGAVALVAFVACLFLPAGPAVAGDAAGDDAGGPAGTGKAGPLVHRAGLRPGLAYWASVWGYTAFSAFLPLHVAALGGSGSGPHFLLYGCVLLAVRLGGQRWTNRIGPVRTATVSLLVTAAGLALLVAWPSVAGALAAAAVIGAGQALGLPAFLTMAVTGLPATQRGSAVATTTAFFDLGFTTAALALGAVVQSSGLAHGFAVAGCVPALAPLLFLSLPRKTLPREALPREARETSSQGGSHDRSHR